MTGATEYLDKCLLSIRATRGTSFLVINECEVLPTRRCGRSRSCENLALFSLGTLRSLCQYRVFVMGVGNSVTAVYTACHIPIALALLRISDMSSGARRLFRIVSCTHRKLICSTSTTLSCILYLDGTPEIKPTSFPPFLVRSPMFHSGSVAHAMNSFEYSSEKCSSRM